MIGTTIVAMVLIGAFAIDRIVTALLFLLSFIPTWKNRLPEPSLVAGSVARNDAEKRQKLAYFLFASAIAILLIRSYPKALVLTALGIPASVWADHFFTLLVLVGGADRIAELLGSSAGARASDSSEAPIRVMGTLTLEQPASGGGGSRSAP